MLLSKGSYGYGEPKNVLLYSVEKPHLPVLVCKLPRFMGGSTRPRMEICEALGLPIPMVPHFHQRNVYSKSKLQVWRAQKCIPIVGIETVLTSAGPQTSPFRWGQYTADNGNLCKFRPTYLHGTAFSQKECLYQKEATGMESSKMYCPSWCRNRTYQCGAANYPVLWGGNTGPRMEICETSGQPIGMV